MAKSGNTMFAVLGVLTKGVYSGYDIKKHFSGSLHHFWSESYGQIYPALKELVAQGYAVEASTPNQTRGQKSIRLRLKAWIISGNGCPPPLAPLTTGMNCC